MQSNSLIMILILIVALPFIIISSNHNAFFIILSVILLASSARNVFEFFINKAAVDEAEVSESEVEDLETVVGFDVKKVGRGTIFVKNFIIALFLLYSYFYMAFLWQKILIIILSAYWIILSLPKLILNSDFFNTRLKLSALIPFIVDISMLVIISSAIYIKYFFKY